MSIKNLPADYLLAAQQGDIDKVKTCLALGVDINTCDRQGKTAITLASLYQQYACVQALIDAGADINKQDHTCLNPFLIVPIPLNSSLLSSLQTPYNNTSCPLSLTTFAKAVAQAPEPKNDTFIFIPPIK